VRRVLGDGPRSFPPGAAGALTLAERERQAIGRHAPDTSGSSRKPRPLASAGTRCGDALKSYGMDGSAPLLGS